MKIFFLASLLIGSVASAQIKIALNWKPEPQFGGFYAAEEKGLFKAQKLDVKLIPGGSGTPTIQMLAAGQVDYAVVSGDEILMSHDRGAKDVVAIFAVYQKNPQGIMIHATQKISKLSELFEKKDMTLLWQSGLPYAQFMLKKYKPAKIKFAPYLGGIANFQADHKIAQQVFVTSEPLAAQKAGLPVKVF